MKLLILPLSFFALSGTQSATAAVADLPLRPFVAVEGGLYDSSDAYLGMVEWGLGYETGPLVHYLFTGAGKVHFDNDNSVAGAGGDGDDSLGEMELGYRLAYPINETMSVFAEVGAESFNGSAHMTDALGNPTTLSRDSDHWFLGAGFQVNLWKGLNVDVSCRYLIGVDDAAFGQPGSDALGNPLMIEGDTPNVLVKFGVSYCF